MKKACGTLFDASLLPPRPAPEKKDYVLVKGATSSWLEEHLPGVPGPLPEVPVVFQEDWDYLVAHPDITDLAFNPNRIVRQPLDFKPILALLPNNVRFEQKNVVERSETCVKNHNVKFKYDDNVVIDLSDDYLILTHNRKRVWWDRKTGELLREDHDRFYQFRRGLPSLQLIRKGPPPLSTQRASEQDISPARQEVPLQPEPPDRFPSGSRTEDFAAPPADPENEVPYFRRRLALALRMNQKEEQ